MGANCCTEDFALFVQMADLTGDFANNSFKRGSEGEVYVQLWQYGLGGKGRANRLAGDTEGGRVGDRERGREEGREGRGEREREREREASPALSLD